MLGGRYRYPFEAYQRTSAIFGVGVALLCPVILQVAKCLAPPPSLVDPEPTEGNQLSYGSFEEKPAASKQGGELSFGSFERGVKMLQGKPKEKELL